MTDSDKEALMEVLSMSLYDIMNRLCDQMMKKEIKQDWIGFQAINGIDHKKYDLKVCLKVVE